MGVYRMTPRPQMFMSSILRPAMSFLDMRNDFPGAALAGMHNKEVFSAKKFQNGQIREIDFIPQLLNRLPLWNAVGRATGGPRFGFAFPFRFASLARFPYQRGRGGEGMGSLPTISRGRRAPLMVRARPLILPPILGWCAPLHWANYLRP